MTEYQVVPFPLAETQTRLLAFLWASLLPSFPAHPVLPPNPSNPYSNGESESSVKTRKVVGMRKEFVLGHPYEWTYEEYIMDLCLEAGSGRKGSGKDGNASDGVPECWKRVEQWRRDFRSDTTLRRRTLGY
jgi:hypothetical protein